MDAFKIVGQGVGLSQPAIDPVCGMTVNLASVKPKAEYGGSTYYFCCSGCASKFQASPQRYLNQTAGPHFVRISLNAQKAAAKSAVVQAAKDPVCGMRLGPVHKSA